MNPGEYRHRITFETKNGVDGQGFRSNTWTEVKKAWAAIKTVNGKEYTQAASDQSINTVRFIIRYTTGITNDMRVKYKGRIFDIKDVINDGELNKTLTIIVKEVV